jgi:hypothetical protein
VGAKGLVIVLSRLLSLSSYQVVKLGLNAVQCDPIYLDIYDGRGLQDINILYTTAEHVGNVEIPSVLLKAQLQCGKR